MRPVGLLTDYGPGSEHVGALHAVLAGAAPGADRIDLAHDVPPGDVTWGAVLLARLVPLMPPGAVVVAVVDPGVGTGRRGLGVGLHGDRWMVGPDNGLLGHACDVLGALAAVEVTAPEVLREPVSSTFHGRDVFAPAAAHLARGGDPGALGGMVDPADVRRPRLPAPEASPGRLDALAIGCDRFGNITLHASGVHLDSARLRAGDRVWVSAAGHRRRAGVGRTFADVPRGGLLLYPDSHGMLALAVNGGSARERLGCGPGEVVAVAAAARE